MEKLRQEVQTLHGVGPRRAALFVKLGVRTVGDLLYTFPRGYEDFSKTVSVTDAVPGEVCCLRAVATSPVRLAHARGGMLIGKARAADDTGAFEIVFFNNRFAEGLLKAGESYLFYGRMGGTLFRKSMASPECIPVEEAPGMRPVYGAVAGLPSRAVERAMREAIKLLESETLSDGLPDRLRAAHHLCHLDYALRGIHFPQDAEMLAEARRRLVFGELLALLLGMGLLRRRQDKGKALPCPTNFDFLPFFHALPFTLTGAQKRAISEAAADMEKEVPMNRLIEGDVGSGKTAVAAALCVLAHAGGMQSALMAPTEILAAQHAQTLSDMLAPLGIKVGLLTGGLPAAKKREVKAGLADGSISLAVGTHALLQEDVSFQKLGFVITDEQHRFGVAQRACLAVKGGSPHMLIMSATPIPRTLSLLIYGDLNVSRLDELPVGRKPVETYLVGGRLRTRVRQFLRKQIREGFQAYIVCPLVEADESGLAAAVSLRAELARALPDIPVGLLHGKMPSKEKEAAMRAFTAGETKLLVATTVVEVGVDVPRASVMVVENAERFGLSQLHQLRGRVGRGAAQSYCILISDAEDALTRERLKTLCRTADGFAVAEKDLALRGPGDFFGKRQHGLPALAIADLMGDMAVLKETKEAAAGLLREDPELRSPAHTGLRRAVKKLFSESDVVFN